MRAYLSALAWTDGRPVYGMRVAAKRYPYSSKRQDARNLKKAHRVIWQMKNGLRPAMQLTNEGSMPRPDWL